MPEIQEFTFLFERVNFRNDYVRDRLLVRYILTKLARHFGMPEEVDLSMMTIEHIKPQSEGEYTGDAYDLGAIGNLLFINESLNGKIDNKPFLKKMEILKAAPNVYMDDELRNAVSWDEDAIAIRGERLATLGHSQIWKI